jgi:hypothetical protein
MSSRERNDDAENRATVQFSIAGAPNRSIAFPTKILVLRNQLFNQ